MLLPCRGCKAKDSEIHYLRDLITKMLVSGGAVHHALVMPQPQAAQPAPPPKMDKPADADEFNPTPEMSLKEMDEQADLYLQRLASHRNIDVSEFRDA